MRVDRLLITSLGSDRRAAALALGRLVAFAAVGPERRPRAGDVYLGRVTKTAAAMAAAFVDLGEGESGLLMQRDAAPGAPAREGDRVVVTVLRGPDGHKLAKLSARAAMSEAIVQRAAERAATGLLAPAPDPVDAAVTAAIEAGAEIVCDDAALLARLRALHPAEADRFALHREAAPLFAADAVEEQLEAALASAVALPSGGRLLLAETPAAVAIDVDQGAATGSPEAAARRVNVEAMAEIGRLVRLLDLAGRIVVDPLPTGRGAREAALDALRAALPADDGRVLRIGGYTRLGMIELDRERRGPSLLRLLGRRCQACGDGGWRKADWVAAGDALRTALAYDRATPGWRRRLAVAPEIAAALTGAMADARRAAEERLGGPLAIAVDPALAPEAPRFD